MFKLLRILTVCLTEGAINFAMSKSLVDIFGKKFLFIYLKQLVNYIVILLNISVSYVQKNAQNNIHVGIFVKNYAENNVI